MRVLTIDDEHKVDPEIVPYRKLLLAILERAMLDYKGYGYNSYSKIYKSEHVVKNYRYSTLLEAAADAKEWMSSNDDSPFSFLWILDQLDISYAQFTKMLNEIKPNTRIISNYVARYNS